MNHAHRAPQGVIGRQRNGDSSMLRARIPSWIHLNSMGLPSVSSNDSLSGSGGEAPLAASFKDLRGKDLRVGSPPPTQSLKHSQSHRSTLRLHRTIGEDEVVHDDDDNDSTESPEGEWRRRWW